MLPEVLAVPPSALKCSVSVFVWVRIKSKEEKSAVAVSFILHQPLYDFSDRRALMMS